MKNHQKCARELVAKMTLEEKASQMLYGAAQIEHLGIPSYNYWNEALHGIARSGTATMFPQAIGLAASFDPDYVRHIADTIATEGRAKYNAYQEEGDHAIYKGITYWTPNINIFRDPRWGRGHETYGEDPYLTARMGVAFIKGLQGDDKENLKTAACAKHYAVHSGPEDLRHEFNAEVNHYDLWNTYLPAFEAAVKEGEVEAVMGAYNRTNGEPCCGSPTLLQEILRDKWGFDGHVVSDCWAIKDFHEFHGVTTNIVESVALAVSSGCDLNCGNLYAYVVAAMEEGLLDEEAVTTSVERLMTSRMRLHSLDGQKSPYDSLGYEMIDSPAHRQLNLEAAQRTVVLLKNDKTLPLQKNNISSIAVIGPNADSRRALEGNYEGTASQYITVLDGIREHAEKDDIQLLYALGSHLYKDHIADGRQLDDRLSEAVSCAKRADAVVLCLGTDADIEGEQGDAGNIYASGDKPDLNLPGRQQHLLETVTEAAGDKPVIVVLISGSALGVDWADDNVGAILQAFYPGSQGGRAIADIIFGDANPEGKLPLTFYRATEALPDFEDYDMTNRTYRYFQGEALYPFGFGLTYSSYALSTLVATKETCQITVKNTGSVAGRETVQVYVKSPGQKENYILAGIQKVQLNPGEEKIVTATLWQHAFSRYNEHGDPQTIVGEHTLYAGISQPDARSVELCGVQPLKATVIID